MRVLALLTDGFGGFGGISVANRHFLRGLCKWEDCEEVVALPRLIPEIPGPLPDNLQYLETGTGGKVNYMKVLLKLHTGDRSYDMVWCGHINLLPAAVTAKKITGAPLVLHIHGIEAWQPTPRRMVNYLVRYVDNFISVSEVTKKRFVQWSGIAEKRGFILPNTIDFDRFSPGPKNPKLLQRYGLNEDHYILLTLGRLVGSERNKGFDRVLDVMPKLLKKRPETRYLIAGKGPDRERLQQKAVKLGLSDQVIFTGYVEESEKEDHYRLADCYVMPSEGEGFGLVLLEAMACGVPVIGSTRDGTREVLKEGALGIVVDPRDERALLDAILNPLKKNSLHEQVIQEFTLEIFNNRLQKLFNTFKIGKSVNSG